ncbi:hypothetical protein [Malaciobacter marinus]|uniref:hypothetical protein n=1 Tax=Malaciobacter marinus TaxID=505249 RepID=UPI003B008DB0
MRRNPNFRVSEIEMVCGVSTSYLQKYLRTLVAARYIVFISKVKKPYSNREYRLIKNTGVKAPVYLRDGTGLYDENLNKKIITKETNNMKFKDLYKVLKMIKNDSFLSLEDISKFTRVSFENIKLEFLKSKGLVLDKLLEEDVYIFNSELADVLIDEIKKNSIKTDEQMEELWKQLSNK